MTAAQSVRQLIAAWMLASSFICSLAWAADKPEIEASIEQEEIYAGESVVYRIEIRNSKNPSAPDVSPLKETFDVVAAGDVSRNQTSTIIINNNVKTQTILSHVYQYVLTPKKSGQLTIPAVTATIDGKTLTSDSLTLHVIEAEQQDVVRVEVEADHEKVYPTQPFTVTVRVLVQPLPYGADQDPLTPLRRQLPHLQLNWVDPPAGLSAEDKSQWLQPLLSENGVGFTLNDVSARSGFFLENSRAVFNFHQHRESRKGMDGKSIRYFVYELSRTFTPEKTGEYTFGPALVKGAFVTGAEGNSYTARRLVAGSEPVTVEVRNVPSPRPATFCGGIGQYKLRASASPTKLRVGDPLTLTIELEQGKHSGSLELISAPDLSAVPELMDDFELIDKNPTGRIEGHAKKFSYALRPKKPNASIPVLTLFTFDPVKEDFVSIQSNGIALEVLPASRVAASELVGANPTKAPTEIKSRSEGIFQNITDLKEVRDERIDVLAWSEVTLGIWLVAIGLMFVTTWHRRRSADPVRVRRNQARRVAQQRLADARRAAAEGNSLEALREVRAALIGLVADSRNLIVHGLTTSEILQQLDAAHVPAEDRSAFEQLLEAIEAAEYGAIRAIDSSVAIDSATSLVRSVAPFLERVA